MAPVVREIIKVLRTPGLLLSLSRSAKVSADYRLLDLFEYFYENGEDAPPILPSAEMRRTVEFR